VTINQLPNWRYLARLSEEALSRYDIAVTHLACVVGLPGAEKIQSSLIFFWLDYFAQCAREYTEYQLTDFHQRPHKYNNSEAFFRMLCLVTVLQRDMGVRYNPAKISESAVFELPDSFIHGIFQGVVENPTPVPEYKFKEGSPVTLDVKSVAFEGGTLLASDKGEKVEPWSPKLRTVTRETRKSR
jgi:hypothetical protein